MAFILTIVGLLCLFDLLWWWWGDRRLRPLPGARNWRVAWAAFIVVQFASLVWMFAGRLLKTTDRPDEWLPVSLVSFVFLWHLIVLPATVVLWLIVSLLLAPVRVGRRMTRREPTETPDAEANSPAPEPEPVAAAPTGPMLVRTARGTRLIPGTAPDLKDAKSPRKPREPRKPMTRREVLGAAAALTPPLVTAIGTGVALPQLDHFRVRRIDIPLAGLPPALEGLTIAHVTDIHVGRFTGGRVLNAIVEQTNQLKADLVLLTGDLINHALSDLDAGLDLVKKLDPRYARAMCEGNHDLIEDRREFETRTKRSGVTLLVNESTTVTIKGQRVQLMGLRWGSGVVGATRAQDRGDEAIRTSMAQLLAQRRDDSFPILLAHHPHAFDPASEAGIPLTLAGHTHGGQLMLNDRVGFGPAMYRYWSGLYRKNDSALVVSNGVGNWFPLRVNAPAEIVHITLRRAV